MACQVGSPLQLQSPPSGGWTLILLHVPGPPRWDRRQEGKVTPLLIPAERGGREGSFSAGNEGPVPARWSVVFSSLIQCVAQFRVGSETRVQHGPQWTPGSQLELRFGGQQARQSHRSSPEPAVVIPGPRACPRHAQLPP